jgi:hypothetical protein
MIVDSDGYRFDFQDAIAAFKFDEKDPTSPTFHGAPMKAVDVIAELEDAYLFIEVKEYVDPKDFDLESCTDENKHNHFKWLKGYLKYKFRDSLLYRYAENKSDKPVFYLCLLNFDDALNLSMKKQLSKELPVGRASRRWKRTLVKGCQVLNLDAWNRNYPKWQVEKI